jgi:hypothetical protein
MLPKLKALRIRSVLKYLAQRPYSEPKGWSLMTFRMKLGRASERIEGNVLDRTRSYERAPWIPASLPCQLAIALPLPKKLPISRIRYQVSGLK